MSPSDEQHQAAPTGTRSPLTQTNDGPFRRATGPMSDGRASGELEGSTLGSSSRDGDRRTPGHRRAPSSGGFLLDSMPRSKSARITSHRPRPSEPPPEKRSAPEAADDVAVHKKRSRFPWSRHKTSTHDSTPSSPTTARHSSTLPRDARTSAAISRPESETNEPDQAPPSLDRDSLQIVNLALNLNESRRRTASGMPPGSGQRRPLSGSHPGVPPVDIPASPPRGGNADRDNSRRHRAQSPGDQLARATPVGMQSPVVDFLPPTVVDDNRAYEFSDNTLARAERARSHFDLFHEYLRLLPLLPPLRSPGPHEDHESSSTSACRGYNPLQMIRNRKLRYREKSSIDAQAAGWHDVGRVHDWINSIDKKYGHIHHDQTQSINLPSFHQGQRHGSHGGPDDPETFAVSPPSSLRRASRTSSIHKAQAPRPRLDWKFSPAELLADAAWVEDGTNKSKIVDKDGNQLYPDPTELVLMDTNPDHPAQQDQRPSVEIGDPAVESASSRPNSLASSRPALNHEFKSVGRGRHRHRLHSHSHSTRSRSASSTRKKSKWDKVRMRSSSVSSDSSAEPRESLDRRWPSKYRKDTDDIHHRNTAAVFNAENNKSQQSGPPPLNTKTYYARRNESLSSIGSLEDRYNPRMSLEGMDSTAPSSPVHAGYFPSIAVNLSPVSSRDPSPTKKGLRQKIVSRHERSKSKLGDQEQRKRENEAFEPEVSPSRVPPPPVEQDQRTSKLEPSPLPDVVSSNYPDDQDIDGQRADGFRGRKGQHLPESKLRGIFKGPGRIAEIVGNEVSKVGDMILKKEQPLDSRKSSSATTLGSDDSESDEDKRVDKRYGTKGLLRRRDESGRLIRRDSDKGASSKSFIPSLPSFTSPLRQDDRNGSTEAGEFGSPAERGSASRKQDERDAHRRLAFSRSKTIEFGSPLNSRGRSKPHVIKDPSVPFSLTRPPVTGLAQARASPGPSREGRGRLGGTTRAWSISDRSLHTLNDSGVPGKTEVERTRALLLSSGIKAREITRRAHSVRDPPPHWLQSSFPPNSSIPRVTRLGEFDLAAQNLLRRFETTQYSFQQSMHHFGTTSSSPLRSRLKELETLVNQSLTPRVRATANEAEDLCVQLNSTSTLAVKALTDALDKGIRRRRRRLRFARRAGFVVLEWALVAMLWWVWLIVMAFKLVRGVFRGVVSGARWILWL